MRFPLRLGRADDHFLARWFWTIDKKLVTLIFILIGFGMVAVAAASPVPAFRLSGAQYKIDPLLYMQRQMFWIGLAVPLMLGVSMLSRQAARRVALVGTAVLVLALAAVIVPGIGVERNGAFRWLSLAGFEFQPIEFLKPLFIVSTAWLFAMRFEDKTLPVLLVGLVPLGLILFLLVKQPDFGQAALVSAIWLAQAVIAGLPVIYLGAALGLGAVGFFFAYQFAPHIQNRINSFLHGEGDTFQIDRALDCFRSGGFLGVGPGEGTAKFRLPEAHTDYIFSVIGEEFGAIGCLVIAALFLWIVLHVLLQLLEEEDPFLLMATGGLITMFGGQAMINMSVNLSLAPSKGMTLPFISYGGSSFLATAIGMGLLLAITRRNRHVRYSPYLKAVSA